MTLEKAYQRCHSLTRERYENFPVARLVPKKIRPYVCAIYAFARTADDIADEDWDKPDGPTVEQRLNDLNVYEAELLLAIKGLPLTRPEWEWIFLATANTIREMDLPVQLFQDLLSAFKQDVVTLRYETFDDLLDYCRRSANPVGRLVLLLHGYRDDARFAWSDKICTGLQLANFWQDVSVDIKKNRIYVPQEDWTAYKLEESMFSAKEVNQSVKDCIQFQVARTNKFFREGRGLSSHLKFPLSLEIRLTCQGGMAILEKIAEQDFDTITKRPRIGSFDKIRLLAQAIVERPTAASPLNC